MSYPRLSTILIALVAVPACATKVLPQQQMLDTQSTIASAEEIDASENADAKLHLQYAREQLETAKRLMADGEDDEALRMLDRSSADAELALTLARTEQVKSQSGRAIAEVDALRNDEMPSAGPRIAE